MRATFFLSLLICLLRVTTSQAQESITLLTPDDLDTINTKYPLFSWYYVDSPKQRKEIQYTFTLVELTPDQDAQSGVSVNIPILRIENVQGFQLMYPYDAPELQYNHRYGWRIQRLINGTVTQESEAWEFTLYKKEVVPVKYAILNTEYNATLYEANSEGFFFKFPNKYKSTESGSIQFTVYNEKSELVKSSLGKDEKMVQENELEQTGRDFYFLKTTMYPAGIYTLVVKDQKGNKFNTRFIIK